MFAELSLLESTANSSANCIFHTGINQRRANRHRFLRGEDERGTRIGMRNEIAADNMLAGARKGRLKISTREIDQDLVRAPRTTFRQGERSIRSIRSIRDIAQRVYAPGNDNYRAGRWELAYANRE
jgi:hypothetical protein